MIRKEKRKPLVDLTYKDIPQCVIVGITESNDNNILKIPPCISLNKKNPFNPLFCFAFQLACVQITF